MRFVRPLLLIVCICAHASCAPVQPEPAQFETSLEIIVQVDGAHVSEDFVPAEVVFSLQGPWGVANGTSRLGTLCEPDGATKELTLVLTERE